MRFFFSRFAVAMTLVYAGVLAAAAPAPEMTKPDLERGKQIATTVCAACHGADGISVAPANPHLAGQHAEYVAAQLAAFKSGARPSPIMAGMAAGLSPEDMQSLGAYYQSQKPAAAMARDKALVARGQAIWRSGVKSTGVPACAGCHGAAGKGIPSQYPRLAGQHPDLTMGWLKAYATGARPHQVMSAVAVKLSENDMKAVSEYAAGLR
jgi:cytochrome c553